MPILLPPDTRAVLGSNVQGCESRSLALDRFADPTAKDKGISTPRKDWFRKAAAMKPEPAKRLSWNLWLRQGGSHLGPANIVLGKLQSRMMVNMAGGVLENAGICLDRFGVPYIPGSAVKGCARRMAIQKLMEVREGNQPVEKLVQILTDVALGFGWGEQDWKTKEDALKQVKRKNNETELDFTDRKQKIWEEQRSDFAYACGDSWGQVMRGIGLAALPFPHKDSATAKDFGAFGGAVSFLAALPWQMPADSNGKPSDIELDVLTCHHPDYYENKSNEARDTEEPVPVIFPAIAAGLIFQFAVLPLRGPRKSLSQPELQIHQLALEWLREGLQTFGVGAKTAAGYGWFDASKEFNEKFFAGERRETETEINRIRMEKEAADLKEKDITTKAENERLRSSLAPDETWIENFKSFNESKRREILNKFAFDEAKWWPQQGELSDERIQFSIFHFLLNVEPTFLAEDRSNSNSKIAKALAALKRKFPAIPSANKQS